MVFQIHHRVPGKLAHAFPLPEAAQLAVVAHGVHIAVGHRPVEPVFLAGVPVFNFIHFIVGFQKQPFLLVTHLTPAFCGAVRCRPLAVSGELSAPIILPSPRTRNGPGAFLMSKSCILDKKQS